MAYRQQRPFQIYVAGPKSSPAGLFYSTFVDSVGNGHSAHDDALVDDIPTVTNSSTIIHQARVVGGAAIRYNLVFDDAILDPRGDSLGAVPRLDAVVLVIGINVPAHFSAVRDNHAPRVVKLAQQQGAEKMVLFIVADRENIFSYDQCFEPVEMARLVKSTHATYKFGKISQHAPCRNVMDDVIAAVVNEHAAYQLREPVVPWMPMDMLLWFTSKMFASCAPNDIARV